MATPSTSAPIFPHRNRVLLPPPALPAKRSTAARRREALSLGIQVAIKPEYRITPPDVWYKFPLCLVKTGNSIGPQLPPQLTEVPRSTFNFDFEYERKILAEAEKENPNWSKFVIESQPPPPPQPPRGPKLTTPTTSVVKEFVKSYNALHEMGFTSSNVPELLAIHDNDPDKVAKNHSFNCVMNFFQLTSPE
uniref:Proline-rich cell wall protein-like n=1 Tax=Oryza punctata TaxID=4537 RepID=A0A1V1H0Q4_ORYPU|nr:proline-rich cell wall protein-like [Oryza punctata]